jgi:hypothetical protein
LLTSKPKQTIAIDNPQTLARKSDTSISLW